MHGPAKAIGARAANRTRGGATHPPTWRLRPSADTAAKTGKPERTIQRDATRAKALGLDLDRVSRRRVPTVRKWNERPVRVWKDSHKKATTMVALARCAIVTAMALGGEGALRANL